MPKKTEENDFYIHPRVLWLSKHTLKRIHILLLLFCFSLMMAWWCNVAVDGDDGDGGCSIFQSGIIFYEHFRWRQQVHTVFHWRKFYLPKRKFSIRGKLCCCWSRLPARHMVWVRACPIVPNRTVHKWKLFFISSIIKRFLFSIFLPLLLKLLLHYYFSF